MGRPRMYGSPISEWAMSSEEKAMRDHILNALNNNNPEELDAAKKVSWVCLVSTCRWIVR